MNKLQAFCAALDGGFLTAPQLVELVKLDRLFPVLVRCGMARFTCGAQDCAHLLRCIAAGGDYVRDVSLPIGWEARAASWVECCPVTPAAMFPASFVAPRPAVKSSRLPSSSAWFNEGDCGGVFDGHRVSVAIHASFGPGRSPRLLGSRAARFGFFGRPPSFPFSRTARRFASEVCFPPRRPRATAAGFFMRAIC